MATHKPNLFKLAGTSMWQCLRLAAHGRLHLRRHRLGAAYDINQAGRYSIFRETVSSEPLSEPGAVLVVGFRLRLLGSSSFLHWLFQRLCILTTPFWSGFHGFRVKLWMVDRETKNYLGIYDWAGAANATHYVEALTRVLVPLSTPDSVWCELHTNQSFEVYLSARRAERTAQETHGKLTQIRRKFKYRLDHPRFLDDGDSR
jgi:hypothetical protein